MNYYEHHLGDWAAATGHLTWDEDMAYTRLLRAYYHHEQAIPEGQQYRLAKAATPVQRKAVDQVLSEFFELRNGRWHQKRADAEVARYQDKQEKAKRSAEARWKGRKPQSVGNANAMRTDATEGGAQAADKTSAECKDLNPYISLTDSQTSHDAPKSLIDNAAGDANAMRTHSEGNALQTPDTRHQSSYTNTSALAARAPDPAEDAPDPPPSPPPPAEPTRAAAATLRMRAAGLADANPAHPTLLALLQAGVTDDELADAAALAAGKGKSFAYALAVAEGRRRDAASTGAAVAGTPRPAAGASPPVRLSAYERELAAKRREWERMTNRVHPDNLPQHPAPLAEVIDITPAVPLLAKGAP